MLFSIFNYNYRFSLSYSCFLLISIIFSLYYGLSSNISSSGLNPSKSLMISEVRTTSTILSPKFLISSIFLWILSAMFLLSFSITLIELPPNSSWFWIMLYSRYLSSSILLNIFYLGEIFLSVLVVSLRMHFNSYRTDWAADLDCAYYPIASSVILISFRVSFWVCSSMWSIYDLKH